jgi:hypothetical protein
VNKETIVQFVCFTSILDTERFKEIWEPSAKLLVSDPANSLLLEGVAEKNGNRFNYVSQHMCSKADFKFAFTKEKKRIHFPEHRARIMEAGGYLPMPDQSTYNKEKHDVRIMAFIAHNETQLDFYDQQTFSRVNIYEAYFENCAYGHVMEFFLPGEDAPVLLQQLKARPGVEAAIYKECRVFQASKKVSGSFL